MISKENECLLKLLAAGMHGSKVVQTTISKDLWQCLYEKAQAQAVAPMVLQGALPMKEQMPPELLDVWKKQTIASVVRNERVMAVQDKLLVLLEEAEIPCVVLKGCTVARYYWRPDLRTLGDVDVLVSRQAFLHASELLIQHGYRLIEQDNDIHAEFVKDKVLVELHYTVTNFPELPGAKVAQGIMADCLMERKKAVLERHTFPVLSDVHQALSLLLHMERHMVIGGIGLRQLCDWLLFLESLPQGYFEQKIFSAVEACGLGTFAKALAWVGVEYLDMDHEHAPWCKNVNKGMAEELLAEILRTGNFGRGTDKDDASSYFVDRNGTKNYVLAMIRNLNKRARQNYPLAKKCTVTLPFFWVRIAFVYLFHWGAGRSSQKSLRKTLTNAQNRKRLYGELRLFDIQKND